MLILGGMNTEAMFGDGFVLNATSKTVKQVRTKDVQLDFPGNAWRQVKTGQIAALTIADEQLRIISYAKGDTVTKFIANFGNASEQ